MLLSVRRKCSLSSFPILLLQRVKPKAITLHQTFLPFYIETVLGFEVWIQMVLKESVGALKASGRWRGWGAAGDARKPLKQTMPSRSQGFARTVRQDSSHRHLQLKRFPLLKQVLCLAGFSAQGYRIRLLGSWTSLDGIRALELCLFSPALNRRCNAQALGLAALEYGKSCACVLWWFERKSPPHRKWHREEAWLRWSRCGLL